MHTIITFGKKVPLIFFAIALISCAGNSPGQYESERALQIKNDRAATQNFEPGQTVKISIEDALNLGVQNNMDARVSALEYLSAQKDITLEKLKAFPAIEYSLTRTGRSNPGASSSLSASTGLQSLEPSISSEQYRTLNDLDINWNLIDVATAVMQSKSAIERADLSAERHRKVLQNIRKDVYAVYWRVLADQETKQQTQILLEDIQKQKQNLDTALKEKLLSRLETENVKNDLTQRQMELEALAKENSAAIIEFQSLLSLPYNSSLTLTSKNENIDQAVLNATKADVQILELTALKQRPEMREAFIDQKISARDARLEILKTIPGAKLFFGLKDDTNRFLEDNQWSSFSAAIVQNITSLITLPARYSKAKNLEELARARHLAKATAIMAQVHLSRHGLIYAKQQYINAKEHQESGHYTGLASQESARLGRTPAQDALLKKIDAHIKRIRRYQAYAALQDQYASLLLSTGHDIGTPVVWKNPEVSG